MWKSCCRRHYDDLRKKKDIIFSQTASNDQDECIAQAFKFCKSDSENDD